MLAQAITDMLILKHCVLFFFVSVNCCVHGARILGVFAFPSISHQIVFQPIWRELSLRGHQVTVLTPNPIHDQSLTNLTEIDLSFTYKTLKKFKEKASQGLDYWTILNTIVDA